MWLESDLTIRRARSLASDPELTKKTVLSFFGKVAVNRSAYKTKLSCKNLLLVLSMAICSWPALTTWSWQCPTWQTLLMQSRYSLSCSSYMYWPLALMILIGSCRKNSLQEPPISFLRMEIVSFRGICSLKKNQNILGSFQKKKNSFYLLSYFSSARNSVFLI